MCDERGIDGSNKGKYFGIANVGSIPMCVKYVLARKRARTCILYTRILYILEGQNVWSNFSADFS